MRAAGLLDAASAHALGFADLRAAVAPVSEYGERVFAELEPFRPGEEDAAQARAQRIAGVAKAVDGTRLDAVRETLRAAPDAAGAIARASMGDVLGDANFLELQRFADAVTRIDALLAGAPGFPPLEDDGVRDVARALELGRAGKFGFYLADSFGAELAAARAALVRVQAEFDAARGRAVAGVAAALGRDDLGAEEFILMRAQAPASLPAGLRVVREAPTYLLCTVDYDDATLAVLERRDAAATAVSQAEEAVRAALSERVRARSASLDRTARALGEIDVLVAAARYAQQHRCTVAAVCTDVAVAFQAGRYVPLEEDLAREGRAFTPVDVDLHDVAVLTGPNMGGKSVCLRTCGAIAMAAAFGLPVPAERARTALFGEIAWLGIGAGDEDERGGLLSSFAREVVRLGEVLERGAGRLLVLIDEFARTTTPHEGKALLVAVLERLAERGACGFAATHLDGVAELAGTRHFAVRGLRGIPQRPDRAADLHEALARLAESMDYTIGPVEAGGARRSDAIALAALLGLDERIVEAAYRALR